MWKLIYSDYETDKVTRVKGDVLTIKQIMNDYMIPDKTKFTIVGLYADNKKYTVVTKNDRFIFAIKPFSTHKNNNKYWIVLLDLNSNYIREYTTVLDENYQTSIFMLNDILDSFTTTDNSLIQFIENNSPDYECFSITEINRIWFEQMRGESILK